MFVCCVGQISDAVYRQVLSQTSSQFSALVEACQVQKVQLDARLRTDMDQIVTSKEHVSGKIRGERTELNRLADLKASGPESLKTQHCQCIAME